MNLPAPFGFCNLLILQKEESAKRPTQACLSYNFVVEKPLTLAVCALELVIRHYRKICCVLSNRLCFAKVRPNLVVRCQEPHGRMSVHMPCDAQILRCTHVARPRCLSGAQEYARLRIESIGRSLSPQKEAIDIERKPFR